MAAPALRLWDYEAYADLPADGQRYEIMDGELFVSPAPYTRHQTLSRRIQFKLYLLYEESGRGQIFNALCDVILATKTVVQPDLALVLKDSVAQISQRGIEGPPDLVVEILSPSTARVDLRIKRMIYAQHGVREYWVVDPQRDDIQVCTEPNGGFQQSVTYTSEQTLRSPLLPDLALSLAPIFVD